MRYVSRDTSPIMYMYILWLDYRKAFDSIPHSWLLQALKLAKVPGIIINAIKNLTKSWYTILSLSRETETLTAELIKFVKGIFQGDSLSVMLFVLCLNPLSFLLNKCKGYSFGRASFIIRKLGIVAYEYSFFFIMTVF